MRNRVVVTGLGVLSSIGIGVEKFWNNVIKGQSGISEVSSFDTSEYPCTRAGEIRDFNPEEYLTPEQAKKMGRGSQFALAVSLMALKDSGIDTDAIDREKVGVLLGTTNGEAQVLQAIHEKKYIKKENEGIKELCLQYPACEMNANISRELGFQGDNLLIPNACAAGNFAIGYSYDLIRAGRLDYALTGGVDPFSRIAFTGFNRLLAMAREKVQPFDKDRKGMMVGEGAGIFFIESLESALSRGAHIYAEILGYGVSCDAYHMTTPHPEARGVFIAMNRAIRNSGIDLADVDYISPHGTGTRANDKAEAMALKSFFGDRCRSIPISSIKSMLGHTMGAASAIEAVTCALILEHGIIPPTINYEEGDPECDIDCVPNTARTSDVRLVLNNAYAFGGNNSCLVMKKYS